jgi:FkbM family methyltransferase
MSWRTNPLVIGLRNFGRATRMNRLLAALVQRGYEEDYGIGLGSCIRPGDTVWDIGANVGLYTRRFAALTNGHGLVIAFEPSPINFAQLEQVCAPLANVHLHCCGLGDVAGRLYLQQGHDELGATSRVGAAEVDGIAVDIRVGDEVIASGLPAPNVVKLDVEGFEVEVLRGLSRAMESPALRAIGVEVHFGILEERGFVAAPRQIEQQLARAGFRVRWIDSSHIVAVRPN